MSGEDTKSKPDFVLVDQPDIPAFITDDKRKKHLKIIEDERRVYNFFVVLLPMAIFIVLRKEISTSGALLISLGAGAFMKWLCSL